MHNSISYFTLIRRATKTTPVTFAFIGICVVVFIALEIIGSSLSSQDLDNWGAKNTVALATGQFWRLISPIFLHAGILHLLVNMGALVLLGRDVERLVGSPAYAVCVVVAGACGTIASALFIPNVLGVGASGSVFGIVGLYGIYLIINRSNLGKQGRNSLIWLLAIIAINVFIASAIPQIDNAAHLGGLLAGMAIGSIIAPRSIQQTQLWAYPVFGQSAVIVRIVKATPAKLIIASLAGIAVVSIGYALIIIFY